MKRLALFGFLFMGCATAVPATRVGSTPTMTDTGRRDDIRKLDDGVAMGAHMSRRS